MVDIAEPTFKEYAIEEFLVRAEPYYRPVGDELELFTAAYNQHIPVLLKGPTGCGKTRFVEYMAWRLGRPLTVVKGRKGQKLADGEVRVPLVTIACHEDLTASDLVGRYLLDADGTRWIDGPMTRAVKVRRHSLLGRGGGGQERHHRTHSPPHRTTGGYCRWKRPGQSSRPMTVSCCAFPTTPATRALSKT